MTISNPGLIDERETRQRLLDAAAQLFAEHGFKDVSIREICAKAGGANVAAVNYYFRDKAGLYRELLEYMLARWVAERDRHAQILEGKPAEEKLHLYLRWFVGNLLGEREDERDVLFGKILSREMADPTPDFALVVEKGMRPNFERLANIISELMGLPCQHAAVMNCTMSTMGQCLIYGSTRQMSKYFVPSHVQFTPEVIDGIARHLTQFSLAGIRAVTQQNRESGAAGKAGPCGAQTPSQEHG
ncbi:MAG: TetR/AcrR family transcriptional regulator [Terriglobia bacterium]